MPLSQFLRLSLAHRPTLPESGTNTVIAVGAMQPSHVRQTAAAARELGPACEVLLAHRVLRPTGLYPHSANVLLARLFGARSREYAAGTDFDAAVGAVAGPARSCGGSPALIAGSGQLNL